MPMPKYLNALKYLQVLDLIDVYLIIFCRLNYSLRATRLHSLRHAADLRGY